MHPALSFEDKDGSVDITEDFSLEITQEDFADNMEAAIADGTIIASEPDSDFHDDEVLSDSNSK